MRNGPHPRHRWRCGPRCTEFFPTMHGRMVETYDVMLGQVDEPQGPEEPAVGLRLLRHLQKTAPRGGARSHLLESHSFMTHQFSSPPFPPPPLDALIDSKGGIMLQRNAIKDEVCP